MTWLMIAKTRIGKHLKSEPIISDANCTKICIYMSLVLLASSLICELTGFAYADSIGAIGLIYFSVSEGKEAFDKAYKMLKELGIEVESIRLDKYYSCQISY